MPVGERRLSTADRVCYAVVFAVLIFALFFVEAR